MGYSRNKMSYVLILVHENKNSLFVSIAQFDSSLLINMVDKHLAITDLLIYTVSIVKCSPLFKYKCMIIHRKGTFDRGVGLSLFESW